MQLVDDNDLAFEWTHTPTGVTAFWTSSPENFGTLVEQGLDPYDVALGVVKEKISKKLGGLLYPTGFDLVVVGLGRVCDNSVAVKNRLWDDAYAEYEAAKEVA